MARSAGSRWILALALLLGPMAVEVRAQAVSGLQMAAAIEKTLVDMIARNEESVVAIARVRKPRPDDALNIEVRPDAFGRRLVTPAEPQPTDPDFIPNEYGTGVVVDRRGLILTAYHVLSEDSEYYVTTHDRKVYRAWVKGADPRSDLAVLAVDATDLAPIALGDAAKLKKGRIVIALGNPHAVARDGQVSAAQGIVSNLARKAPPSPSAIDSSGKSTLHHFGTLIQTDAKLNFGTSGGPLLDLEGKMVGLTVALAATTGFEQSAGYAIPVDETFRRVVDTLKQGREVEYGFLGIQPVNLPAQEILAGKQGIRVDWVVPGTPAARFGLKPNDVVTAVDGRPVHEADGFVLAVGRLPVEAVTRLGVIRDQRPRSVDVTLAKYPVRGKKIITTPAPAWRGLRVDYPTALVDSDPQTGGGMSLLDDCVIITEVEEGSAAAMAGLHRGMRISHVGRTPVGKPKEFHAVVARQTGPVQLRLAGNGEQQTRTVPSG